MRDDPLPPAFFPVSLNVEGRDCVVIGGAGDREALEKTEALKECGANVRWIQDVAGFRDEDLRGVFFVISTPMDAALSARLRALAERERFLLCCIDQPAYGFVAMQAVAKAGPARITVSTGGVSPAVAKRWREAIQRVLDERFARFLEALRGRRTANRALSDTEARKQAARDAAEGFDVQISVRYPEWFT
jgi:siroheme synthase-like protein